jgi:hypothetical protein
MKSYKKKTPIVRGLSAVITGGCERSSTTYGVEVTSISSLSFFKMFPFGDLFVNNLRTYKSM